MTTNSINSRNSVEQSKLQNELKLIEKEKKNELRIHDSEAQRTRARFRKLAALTDSFSEATGVRMYHTHNPGFCYKRNGEHKTPPKIFSVPCLDFSLLRDLLFTKDELDVEKILILHMLSAHRTESLRMPPKKFLKIIPKENSPIDRLIKKSKKLIKDNRVDNGILDLLPTYIIDIGQCVSCTSIDTSRDEVEEQMLHRDTRLSSRIIINEKLERILSSALGALKKSGSIKFQQIIENGHNTVYLKKIFNKAHIQDFLKTLRTYSLITSCDSYYLTPKIKEQPTHLEIRTIFGHLEAVVLQIRKYVLLLPSKTKNEWKSVYDFDPIMLDDETTSMSSQQNVVFDSSRSSKSTYLKRSSKSALSRISLSARKKSEFLERTASSLGRRVYKNFIMRNIQAVKGEGITRKVFEDDEYDQASVSTFKPDFTQKILSREYFPSNLKYYSSPSNSFGKETTSNLIEVDARSDKASVEEKVLKAPFPEKNSFIKKTSCCACQEKWKCPLPSPKTPRYKRPGMASELYENPFKTNRMNQLSSMINEELFTLNSYTTRYSMDNTNIKIKLPKNPPPIIAPQNEIPTVSDSLEISPYNLAKIEHEIADRETDKKLDEFLREVV